MGEGKAPESFRKACVRFEMLPDISPDRAVAQVSKPTPAKQDQPVGIDDLIRAVIFSKGADHAIGVAQLGALLKQQHERDAKNFGAATWSGYLRLRPDLYAVDTNCVNPRVRLKHP